MEFTVKAVSAGARSGTLMLGDSRLATPCLLLLTRKGLPAFITPDLLDALHPDACALQISPVHFLDSPHPSVVAALGGARRMLCQPHRALVAIARDSLSYETDGENTKFGARFETPNGRRLVRPDMYMDGIHALAPDLWAALPDEVPAWSSVKRNRLSVDRTLLWLDECLACWKRADAAAVLGVVVGASSAEERRRSAQGTASRNVSGFSLGGFGLGESPEDRGALLEAAIASLPAEKVRHVSGLGMPEEVLQAVAFGLDLFDSTYPHTLTVGGFAMTFTYSMNEGRTDRSGEGSSPEETAIAGSDPAKINLLSVTHREEMCPILEGCECYTCRKHTRAYIHHLLNVHEMLAQTLLDIHNYHHYLNFFRAIREAIIQDKFQRFRHWFISHRRDAVLSDVLRD